MCSWQHVHVCLHFSVNRITYCHLPFQSKWLYIGTERGNVHIVNIESFVLSGYVINWNKAIELYVNAKSDLYVCVYIQVCSRMHEWLCPYNHMISRCAC